MKTVQFKPDEIVQGCKDSWKIISKASDAGYIAENQTSGVTLAFFTHAGDGRNYFNPIYVKQNGRHYKAQRYLIKYIPEVRELSAALFFRYQDQNKGELI